MINPDFVREIDFYTGAFPASRSNALSSVMEIKQRDGDADRMHVKASVGASDAALTIEGPLGGEVHVHRLGPPVVSAVALQGDQAPLPPHLQ